MKTISLDKLTVGGDSPYVKGEEELLVEWCKVVRAIESTKRCVVITGAGISVSSGVPDFRSPDGLFQRLKRQHPKELSNGKDLFDAHLFKSATMTELFYTFMGELRHIVSNASCTPSHDFIKELDKKGKLLRCYTQNIDSLEKRAGLETSLYPPEAESKDTANVEDKNKPIKKEVGENNDDSIIPGEKTVIQQKSPLCCSSSDVGLNDEESTVLIKNPEVNPGHCVKVENCHSSCETEKSFCSSVESNESSNASSTQKKSAKSKRVTVVDKKYAKAVQLHGTMEHVICTVCNKRYEFCEKMALEFKTGSPPQCPNCQEIDYVRGIAGKRQVGVGVLRPDVVLYNESHPQGDWIGVLSEYDLNRKPDCLIVIGTSLRIPGVKRLIREMTKAVHASSTAIKRKGCGLSIFVNVDPPTPAGEWGRTFDYHIQGLSDQMVELLKYKVTPEAVQKDKPKKQRQCTLPSTYSKSGADNDDGDKSVGNARSGKPKSTGTKVKEPKGSPKRKRLQSNSAANKVKSTKSTKSVTLKKSFKSTKNSRMSAVPTSNKGVSKPSTTSDTPNIQPDIQIIIPPIPTPTSQECS